MGKQSSAIGDRLHAELAEVVKALILEIDANLRETTPVKTGHARANWVPSVGAPHVGEDGGEAQAAGAGAIASYKLTDGPAWESNNVPYVPRLNDGHSKQAPALFIEAAIDKAIATIEQRYSVTIDLSTTNAIRVSRGLAPR